LVVIGIIAILISVLLPTLQSARRAGVQVKCAASLHQIGDAFKMYAGDNKGWWPIAKWAPPTAWVPAGQIAAYTWQDFLFPYLHKGSQLPTGMFTSDTTGNPELRSDLSALRGKSPLWGCDAFSRDTYFNPNDGVYRYSTGYGMNYYPEGPYPTFGYTVTAAGIATLAFMDYQGTVVGRFTKSTDWGKNGTNRCVIADANQFWIYTSSAQHFKSNFTCEPFFDISGTFVRVDGARHIAPNWTRKKVLNSKGVNVLYCDGHVASASPYEVYNATMGGGYDILAP
jgi:prepilin-type processing-associated H-X9-DG protein